MTEGTVKPTLESKETTKMAAISVRSTNTVQSNLGYSLIGALVFLGVSMIPEPFITIGILKLGLAPALAVITTAASVRGSTVGFLTGYFGLVLHDLLLYGVVVTFTLPAIAYGVMGFIVGRRQYDFAGGRSLAKLSAISMGGLVLTILLSFAIGVIVEGYSMLAAVAFVLLPLVSVGIPSVLLLTPIFARVWLYLAAEMR